MENDHVFDTKFVVCCIPHESLQSHSVIWLAISQCFFVMFPTPNYDTINTTDSPQNVLCQVRDACHQRVAQVIAWSLECATSGVAPSTGFLGEELIGARAKLANSELANGFRAAYMGCKYDAKFRKETNLFPRSYMHNFVCEGCLAQKKHAGWNSLLTYRNFYPDAPHRMTTIRRSAALFS